MMKRYKHNKGHYVFKGIERSCWPDHVLDCERCLISPLTIVTEIPEPKFAVGDVVFVPSLKMTGVKRQGDMKIVLVNEVIPGEYTYGVQFTIERKNRASDCGPKTESATHVNCVKEENIFRAPKTTTITYYVLLCLWEGGWTGQMFNTPAEAESTMRNMRPGLYSQMKIVEQTVEIESRG